MTDDLKQIEEQLCNVGSCECCDRAQKLAEENEQHQERTTAMTRAIKTWTARTLKAEEEMYRQADKILALGALARRLAADHERILPDGPDRTTRDMLVELYSAFHLVEEDR